jgi:serine/threonine protein kinase
MAFKFTVPYEQLNLQNQALFDASTYATAMKRGYAREFTILSACSSCSNVVSGYALGELPGSAHSQPCMLLQLSQVGDAKCMFEPSGFKDTSKLSFVKISGMSGSMSALQAQRIILQVAQGLAAVHAVGGIYCDLKPANLLLFGDPHALEVKLTDFTSSILRTDYDPKSVGMTKEWAAPECRDKFKNKAPEAVKQGVQAAEQGASDTKPTVSEGTELLDIWTLGMLLLWLRKGCQVLSCTAEQLIAEPSCALVSTLEPLEQDFLKCSLRMQRSERWPAKRLLDEHPYLSQHFSGQ